MNQTRARKIRQEASKTFGPHIKVSFKRHYRNLKRAHTSKR